MQGQGRLEEGGVKEKERGAINKKKATAEAWLADIYRT